jgi:ERF superfamily
MTATEELPGQIEVPTPPSRLLSALLAVQAEVGTLPKDKKATVRSEKGSYQYSYSSLDTIVETVGPILNRHGLIWISLPGSHLQTGMPELAYQLIHESGESIEGRMPLMLGGKQDSQALGSAITYARRYALTAVLNLVADEDDDGGQTTDSGRSGGSDASDGGDTVNLQQEAKGLRNEAINAAFAKAGLPAHEKPWTPLGRVPAEKAEALSEALSQQRAMA